MAEEFINGGILTTKRPVLDDIIIMKNERQLLSFIPEVH